MHTAYSAIRYSAIGYSAIGYSAIGYSAKSDIVPTLTALICEGVLINKNIGYSAKSAVPIFGGPIAGTISGMLCT